MAEEKEGAKGEKKKRSVHLYYEINGKKVKRLRIFCERCGPGYFMGDHSDRFTCGHCGFTRYKPAEKTTKA